MLPIATRLCSLFVFAQWYIWLLVTEIFNVRTVVPLTENAPIDALMHAIVHGGCTDACTKS